MITAKEAAALIKDGDTVAAVTFGLAGWAEEVGLAVRDRYLETKHPKGIKLIHAAGIGDWKARGGGVWAEEGMEGMVKKIITSHIGSEPQMAKAIEEEKMECYFWPLGVLVPVVHGSGETVPGPFEQNRSRHLYRPETRRRQSQQHQQR